MRASHVYVLVAALFTLVLLVPRPASAQFGNLGDKAKKEAEKQIPTQPKVEAPAKDSSPAKPASAEESPAEPGSDSASAVGDDFQLYTKFDFVPGQTVLFFDDLTGEELGEFPSRWSLEQGVFEIAQVGKEPWIMVTTRGEIRPKLNVNQLPERYTVEFELLNRTGAYGGAHHIEFFWWKQDGYPAAHLNLFTNTTAYFYMCDDQGSEQTVSDKKLPASFASGLHSVRMMVTKSSVKCYVDNERVVNAPRTAGFTPVAFGIGFHADDADFEKEPMFIRNFRFAEGGKTMREQLDESGHIVTHGIYFDVNSAQIRGESYKTLADITQMLADDPALRLVIEGHTDSDGQDAANLDLSQRRAESVRQYLVNTGKIDAARLEAKGYGESKPLDANTTPEGKANNRRVELAKL